MAIDGVSKFFGLRWEHADTVNYVQTATEGDIVCTTTLDRRNRSNAVLRSEVRHEDGRLLATAIGSYAIFDRTHVRRVSIPAPE